MTVCIPKHKACGWWDPEVDASPPFVAGPTGCTLPVTNENKSRLLAGGTLFRSKGVGLSTNNIKISISIGGSPELVTLNVLVDDILTEQHQVAQGGSPFIDGIPLMRTKLATESNLIEMPVKDVQTTGTGTATGANGDSYTNIWDEGLDDNLGLIAITAQPMTLGEGYGSDNATLSSIRTGPAYTMVYIDLSDLTSNIGEKLTLGATRFWNGACWKSFDPVVPDCVVFSGSPPTPECTGGAAGNCP